MNRKYFLSGVFVLPAAAKASMKKENFNIEFTVADEIKNCSDENFWKQVRKAFQLPEGFVNLENGYFSPQSKSIMQSHQKKEFYINKKTSYFMRREQDAEIERARNKLSDFLKLSAEEIALTRNTTESLNIVLQNYMWSKNAHVVYGNQDYGSMVQALIQAQQRFDIALSVAEIPLLPNADEEIVNAYLQHITNETEMVLLTHMINLTGQIIPIQKIITAIKQKNPRTIVVVDAAHSFAQIEFDFAATGADVIAASLHKWLCNPLGAGFLFVKKDWIERFWPLFADQDRKTNDIRKFEHQGTRPVQTWQTIENAIQFQNQLGIKLREKRLRYLMQRWCVALQNFNNKVQILTPFEDPQRACAIACLSVKNMSASELAEKLWTKYKIFTVAIEHPAVKGVRITPHCFTSVKEIDFFIQAVKEICV